MSSDKSRNNRYSYKWQPNWWKTHIGEQIDKQMEKRLEKDKKNGRQKEK